MSKSDNGVRKELKRIRKEMDILSSLMVKVGIQGDEDSEILSIAGVHEYGATIHAKRAKNLTIPLRKEAEDRSPRSIPGLFFIELDDLVFGVVAKKNRKDLTKKDNLMFYYLLLPSVTIPERSFIRASYDHKKEELVKLCGECTDKIIFESWTAEQSLDNLGNKAVGLTKEFFSEIKPDKSTKSLAYQQGKTEPLIVSGRLRNSITHKVVPRE